MLCKAGNSRVLYYKIIFLTYVADYKLDEAVFVLKFANISKYPCCHQSRGNTTLPAKIIVVLRHECFDETMLFVLKGNRVINFK